MQILYITTMVAIFVLCLMLLSTARRILRNSPLQSGDLGLARVYGTDPLYESQDIEKREEQETTEPSYAVEVVHEESHFDAIENVQPAPAPAIVMAAETSLVTPISEEISAADDEEAAQTAHSKRRKARTQQNLRTRRTSTPSYNYLLEAFLIGISVVVLVKTQRSVSRYGSSTRSRQDVA